MVLAGSLMVSGFLGFQQRAGALKVGRSIDTEGSHVNERHVDAHAGGKGAQLLEFFPLLELRRRQFDEPLQRRAAIGIDADMVEMRAGARGTARSREIERLGDRRIASQGGY